jgi:gluconolactonase
MIIKNRRQAKRSRVSAAALVLLAGTALLEPYAPDSPIPQGAKPANLGAIGAGEGPAWHPGGEIYFTAGGNISRRDANGKVYIFRKSPNGANGLLFDPQGRLIACESRNRRITRSEPEGRITVLADHFEGKRFNSPNDLTIDSKGRIYFSDPRYGPRDDMEMRDSQGKLVEGVYRIDAPGKVARIITHEADRPNGVLVSVNDEFLYVADNNNNTVGGTRKLWRFRLNRDGSIEASTRKLIFDWLDGRGPDGIKMDREGRLYVAGGLNKLNPPFESAEKFKGGIYIISPEGRLLDFVHIPVDEVTNCAFGGSDLKTLYITAGGTLWTIPVDTPGRVPFQRD